MATAYAEGLLESENPSPKKVKTEKPATSTAKTFMRFENVSTNDLPLAGFLLKSGESRDFMYHIGEAVRQHPLVQQWERMKWLKVYV